MAIQHKELSKGRWARMPLCEQMAHVGSEVSRALHWQEKGKSEYSFGAVNRALELIDLTAATLKGYPRLKELLRVREALVDFFYGPNSFGSSQESWTRYFDHFNYRARKNY